MPPETTASAAPAADLSTQQVADPSQQPGQEGQTPADVSVGAAAQPKQEPRKPDAPRTKKLKLKIDGREVEEEVNLDDDEYLTRQIQLAKAAQKRMGEYTDLEKKVRSFIEELKKNPKKVLSDPNIGIDIKKLAASVIEEEIENSKKSPEQLEKEKLQQKLQDLEEERKRERDDFQKREFERLQTQAYERYDMQVSKALEGSDLPKSPYVIKKMADYMLLGLQQGLDVSADDVLPLVRDEMTNDLKEMFAVMPEEVIEKIVGKDVLSRIRKKNVAKAKAAPQTKAPETAAANQTQSKPKTEKKQSFRDFFGV